MAVATTIRAQGLGATGTSSVSLSSYHLPAPSDWQAFERFTRDLFSALWDDPRAQTNGRSGQPQAGVDVFALKEGMLQSSQQR
jgi:hypothetical protein